MQKVLHGKYIYEGGNKPNSRPPSLAHLYPPLHTSECRASGSIESLALSDRVFDSVEYFTLYQTVCTEYFVLYQTPGKKHFIILLYYPQYYIFKRRYLVTIPVSTSITNSLE